MEVIEMSTNQINRMAIKVLSFLDGDGLALMTRKSDGKEFIVKCVDDDEYRIYDGDEIIIADVTIIGVAKALLSLA